MTADGVPIWLCLLAAAVTAPGVAVVAGETTDENVDDEESDAAEDEPDTSMV